MIYRHPTKSDGTQMYDIAKRFGLDENSEYSYLMMSEIHSPTCMVAEYREDIVGFCTGNIVVDPKTMFPDTLFIWQIATHADYRGQGISKEMLTRLVDELKLPYIACTITEENKGSVALFRGVAKHYKTTFNTTEGFTEEDFSGNQKPEMKVWIGPIDWRNL